MKDKELRKFLGLQDKYGCVSKTSGGYLDRIQKTIDDLNYLQPRETRRIEYLERKIDELLDYFKLVAEESPRYFKIRKQ